MHNNYSAHILAINTEEEVFLVKRRDIPIWVIPGGKARNNERPEQTATREFYEETGVAVNKKDITLAIRYMPMNHSGRHKYTFLTKISRKIHPVITNESSDFGFFSKNKLPEPISVYEENRIRDALIGYKAGFSKPDYVNFLSEFRKLSKKPFLLVKLFLKYIWIKTIDLHSAKFSSN